MREQTAYDTAVDSGGGQLAMYTPAVIPRKLQAEALDIEELKTADAVADYLRARGIKGRQTSIESCPLANWAISCGGKKAQVSGSSITVAFTEDANWDWIRDPRGWSGAAVFGVMPNTAAMDAFVKKFDMGQYPDLIES